jgi:sugar phosphate isomerase/epimerase
VTSLQLTRREFCRNVIAASATLAVSPLRADDELFHLNYMLASSLYGKLPLAEILPEVVKTGAKSIDIWRAGHANQREQIAEMGENACAALVKQHGVSMACTTIWNQPFADECRFVERMGGNLLVTGFVPEDAPQKFIEKIRPQLAAAEEAGVTVCIENHGGGFDAIHRFAEAAEAIPQLKVALAPYHLPQEADAIAKLILDLGPKLGLFYAWQHGRGAMQKLPKEEELLQLPGRGDLDFTPILAALKSIRFDGPMEIFMHPFPRGIPIRDTAADVTAEINRARAYLEKCLQSI